MKDNGTDRDIALQMVTLLGDINTALVNINDHKFVPHILTQPTDQEGEVGGTVTFSVVANNVKAYQWQFQPTGDDTWKNSSGDDANTASRTVTVATSNYYRNRFRCQITGLDNSVIYTDVVKITQPEPEPEG